MGYLQIIVFLAIFHSLINQSDSILVMRFQEDGVAVNDSMAEYPTAMDRSRRFSSVTICARFKIFYLHSRGNLIKLMDTPNNKEAMLKGEIWVERVRPVFSHTWNFQILDKKLWAFRWYHLCFTYDHTKHQILTYLDGEQTNEQIYDVGGQIYGDYLNLAQGDDETESFSGDLTQVNVWDKVLSQRDIASIANCESDPTGNYVAWTVEWKINKAQTFDVPLQSLCSQETGASYFWFSYLSEQTAMYVCEALGTHLPVVKNQEETDELFALAEEEFPEDNHCYNKIWAPLNDKQDDGIWRYDYSGEVEPGEVLWSRKEPNGLYYENCALILRSGIADIDCDTNFRCAVCKFTELKRLSLLGICEPELRNIYFVAYKSGFEDLILRSYGKYHIRYEVNHWVWLDAVENITIARMEISVPNYPMGRRIWNLEREVCGQPPGNKRTLLLTPCSENDFTCDDATCIPLTSRCDLRYDCKDKSDELGCNPIAFPEDYQQHLPPRPNVDEDISLPVAIEVIIDALSVKTLQMTIEVTYMVKMSWKENRVNYLNVKRNNTLNIMPYSTFKSLWTPMVTFVNTDGNYHTEVDEESQMFINRLHEANKRDEAAPAEVEVFFGDLNPTSIQRKYTTVFTCSFDLELYPFDEQQCEMHLSMTSAPRTFLYFQNENSTTYFSHIPKLLEYRVGELRLETDNTGFYSDAKIVIPLTRRWGYAILNIYTPSLVLLIVSYVTLFFRPTIFDVRMMSALTAQLVIATFFSQVSSTLPKTSYFKMVDVWLLFCIGITFLVIILHAIVDALLNEPYYKNKTPLFSFQQNGITKVQPNGVDPDTTNSEDNKLLAHRMVLFTKVFTLAIFVIFNLAYWGYILSNI